MFGFGKKRQPAAPRPAAPSTLPPDEREKERRAKPRLVAVKGEPAAPAPRDLALRAGEPSKGPRKLIEHYHEVPASQGLLTIGSRSVMKIPVDYVNDLIAIELGVKRCAILYNPDCKSMEGLKVQIGALRAKLRAEGYGFEGDGDYKCRPEVIRRILADYLAKNGVTDVQADGARIHSHAKSRFLEWFRIAAEQGATDIHVTVMGQSRALVQLRVDGELENLRDEQHGVYSELEAVESMAWPFNSGSTKGSNNSAQWNPTTNLSCMTTPMVVAGKQISLRYQSLRGHLGPKMIARLLNVDLNAPTLTYEQLGYAESQRLNMLDAANMASGFILLAGVTGSGKTTTLKTLVETHPGNGSMAMYSIEDPVEYPLRNVHQIVLQRDVSDQEASLKQYNETVASLMRADPDLVIVGEIRDVATASAGQQLVETGHIAAGTVHAHLLTGIIPRLTNSEIGMSRDVLTNPNMLSLLAYQALVPKLCPKCKQTGAEAIEVAKAFDAKHPGVSNETRTLTELLQSVETRFCLDSTNLRFRNVNGCPHCNHRGTKGVTVVAEMLTPDRQWLEYTRAGKDWEAMVHYRQASDGHFHTPDMTGKTVFEHTLLKAITGGVDARQCSRFDSFKRFDLRPTLSTSDRK